MKNLDEVSATYETRSITAKRILLFIAWAVQLIAGLMPIVAKAAVCTGKGVELQVLGSGGPEVQTKRASSSYLIWVDGNARVLVDSGGGSALRFGESGAQMSTLAFILFTHLHADHTSDFPALIKSSYFEERTQSLPVLGPVGNASFPATTEFVQALFGEKHGAFRYLSDFIEPGQASYLLKTQDVKLKENEIRKVLSQGAISLLGTSVGHGSVPALAWRIEVKGKSIVFSGDTNGEGPNLKKLGYQADLFVAHNAVPEGAVGVERKLHMPPSVIGQIAQQAQVKRIVLSHRMLRTLGREQETLHAIAKYYPGSVVFANDLDCFAL